MTNRPGRVRTYRSASAGPRERGLDFGTAHQGEIARTVGHYQQLFDQAAGETVDLVALGAEALASIMAFSPQAAAELEGLAAGSGVDVRALAALNARTEVLARLTASRPRAVVKGECSTVVHLGTHGRPVSAQTWDWHDLLADDWLLWTIEHADGTVVHTITEYGVLGKIGVNNHGVGVHLNILHHVADGGPIAVPVHVLARTVLDGASGLGDALTTVGAAVTSASTVLTLVGADENGASALCAELSPPGPRFVLPDADGLLVHTNHFLDPVAAAGDQAPRTGPDSYLRLDVLRRALSGHRDLDRDAVVAAMASHLGGSSAVCCHPATGAGLGERWATLVTVALDVRAGALSARVGGPCATASPWQHRP